MSTATTATPAAAPAAAPATKPAASIFDASVLDNYFTGSKKGWVPYVIMLSIIFCYSVIAYFARNKMQSAYRFVFAVVGFAGGLLSSPWRFTAWKKEDGDHGGVEAHSRGATSMVLLGLVPALLAYLDKQSFGADMSFLVFGLSIGYLIGVIANCVKFEEQGATYHPMKPHIAYEATTLGLAVLLTLFSLFRGI